MGQKHETFREFRTPFPPRDIRKNPRSMYARVPQVMAQFVLKIELLSHITCDCDKDLDHPCIYSKALVPTVFQLIKASIQDGGHTGESALDSRAIIDPRGFHRSDAVDSNFIALCFNYLTE